MSADREPDPGLLDRPAAFWAALVLATGIGAWLRLSDLASPSLWVDEFFTIARAGGDPLHWTNALGYLPSRVTLALSGAQLGSIGLANVEHWRELGVSEAAARLGPCLVGLITIPVLGLMARPLAGGGAAGLAMLLLAFSPWHLYASQMARYYTTQFLFANVFLLAFARGATRGSRAALPVAVLAALGAYLCHITSLVLFAIAGGWLLLARFVRVPSLRFAPAFSALAVTAVGCAVLQTVRSAAAVEWKGLEAFSGQDWDPSLWVMALGTAQRIDVVVGVVAVLAAVGLLRARDSLGVLWAAVAILSPLAFFVLQTRFPIAPRYYLYCLFAWLLLAGLWAVHVERHLTVSWGRLAALSGALALVGSLAFGAYLYRLEGAGHRERWREAYALISQKRAPGELVVPAGSRFQARYYLGPDVQLSPEGQKTDPATAPPGTWVVLRGNGVPPAWRGAELEADLPIPAKPWSRHVIVLRTQTPAPAPAVR
jgi:hypothetical protein